MEVFANQIFLLQEHSSSQSAFTWPTSAAEYKLHKRIGNGAFSSVWKAICTSNSVDVAIKIMDLEQITTSFEDILQEVQTMRLCDNDHVLRCFCSFVQKDQLWLVTELMDRGSCLRVMNVARHYGFGEGMNEEWLAYILQETLQGLRYLHDNGQIHRDIKSGNILLDSSGNVRIADFGVSGWTVSRGQRQETVKTFVGTPCWMSPEVMEQVEGYDFRADIWSVGITALELAKGMAPYAKYPPMRVLVLTIEEDPPSLKTYDNDRQRSGAPFSRMFEDFVRKCLQKSPKARPPAEELLKHKFLKGRTRDALLHQLLDHLPAVGAGDEPDQEEEGERERKREKEILIVGQLFTLLAFILLCVPCQVNLSGLPPHRSSETPEVLAARAAATHPTLTFRVWTLAQPQLPRRPTPVVLEQILPCQFLPGESSAPRPTSAFAAASVGACRRRISTTLAVGAAEYRLGTLWTRRRNLSGKRPRRELEEDILWRRRNPGLIPARRRSL